MLRRPSTAPIAIQPANLCRSAPCLCASSLPTSLPAGLLLYAVDLTCRAGQLSNTTVITAAAVDKDTGVATVQFKASKVCCPCELCSGPAAAPHRPHTKTPLPCKCTPHALHRLHWLHQLMRRCQRPTKLLQQHCSSTAALNTTPAQLQCCRTSTAARCTNSSCSSPASAAGSGTPSPLRALRQTQTVSGLKLVPTRLNAHCP